jgi:hypothetical protein
VDIECRQLDLPSYGSLVFEMVSANGGGG